MTLSKVLEVKAVDVLRQPFRLSRERKGVADSEQCMDHDGVRVEVHDVTYLTLKFPSPNSHTLNHNVEISWARHGMVVSQPIARRHSFRPRH